MTTLVATFPGITASYRQWCRVTGSISASDLKAFAAFFVLAMVWYGGWVVTPV